MANPQFNVTLDDIFRTTPVGPIQSSIGGVFYGINHRQTPTPIPINKDTNGLTFFVRPQLNLSNENIRNERKFIPLLTKEPSSIQRIIRSYLDPRLSNSDPLTFGSPFVDNTNAFIPLLTNHLISCSGWPDPVLETFTSRPGSHKEVFGYVDSNIDQYSSFDLTANFRNMSGDPITLLFYTWLTYQANVFEGILSPYPDFITNNEIDYNTRIYRLILDKNKKYVQKIGAVGACYPISVPLGGAYNFEHDVPFNQSNENISINFRCYGYTYNDDIVIKEFNEAVNIFNPSMRDSYINSNMQKIPPEGLALFNNRGYPRINPRTYELEWYVSKDQYVRLIGEYDRSSDVLNQSIQEPRTLDYSFDNSSDNTKINKIGKVATTSAQTTNTNINGFI